MLVKHSIPIFNPRSHGNSCTSTWRSGATTTNRQEALGRDNPGVPEGGPSGGREDANHACKRINYDDNGQVPGRACDIHERIPNKLMSSWQFVKQPRGRGGEAFSFRVLFEREVDV